MKNRLIFARMCNRYGTVELDLRVSVNVGQELNRAFFVSGDYRVPNDTVTLEYFKAFMDTVYSFIPEGSDTLYYQGDLLDLNNYYLRDEIPGYENRTQEYNFRLEVVHLDFFNIIYLSFERSSNRVTGFRIQPSKDIKK